MTSLENYGIIVMPWRKNRVFVMVLVVFSNVLNVRFVLNSPTYFQVNLTSQTWLIDRLGTHILILGRRLMKPAAGHMSRPRRCHQCH